MASMAPPSVCQCLLSSPPLPSPCWRFHLEKQMVPFSILSRFLLATRTQSKRSLYKDKYYHFVSAWSSPQPSLREVQNIDSFPSSANAIAAAINTVASSTVELSFRRDPETKELFSGPSEDFLELCQQQLIICDSLLGANAKFTVYIRPAESYGKAGMEFRRVAAHPKWMSGEYDANIVIVGNYDTSGVLQSAESALLEREAVEIPKLHALVLPMVKDFFLVGMLVAELISPRPQEISKHGKVKALRPEWPPRQGTLRIQQLGEAEGADGKNSNAASPSNIISYFSEEQQSQGRKIAQSLAIASVMDQRALLSQQSSWRSGVHIGDLLEKVRGPLAAIRTLGKMLQPQLKRGEISSDVLEDILVQGEHMKDVVQQFQDVVYVSKNTSNMLHSKNKMNGNILDAELLKDDAGEALSDNDPSVDVQREVPPLTSSVLSASSGQSDREAPMPPVALAPLMHSTTKSCDVSKLLVDLVTTGAVLANKKGKILELRQNSQDSPYVAAVDESALLQAFSNLLEGSLQHILPGGWVKVELMRAPGGGVLAVIDNNGPDLSLMSQAQALAPWGSGLQVGGKGKAARVILNNGTEFTVARDILEQYGGVLRITSPYLPNAPRGMGGTRLEVWLPCPLIIRESEL